VNGRIVILNGAPRSGKSSIAAAMQQTLPGRWINLGVDHANRTLPLSLLPGIGLRPGGERPDLEALIPQLYFALYESIAAHARRGFDIVADLGHHDSYSQPLGILPACARLLADFDVLFVGIHCPINIIMDRRRADPQNGLYLTGDDIPPPVQRWQDAVHLPGLYDLDVNTAHMSPADCVAAIAAALENPHTAFHKLAALS